MANDYYTSTGAPSTRASLTSADILAEFAAIDAAFDKLPPPGSGAGMMNGGSWINGALTSCSLVNCVLGSQAGPATGHAACLDFGSSTVGSYLSLGIGTGGIGRHASYPGGFTLFRSANSGAVPVPAMTFDKNGNILTGTLAAALATTATDGFLYIPHCAGAPTGVPGTLGVSSRPLVLDSTGYRLYVYTNGAWRYAALT